MVLKVVQPDGAEVTIYPINPNAHSQQQLRYPDYEPWKHTPQEDCVMHEHLAAGYYEPPIVGNELGTGRNLISQTLHSSEGNRESQNTKLANLSGFMVSVADQRDKLNRIRERKSFRPPPRVTLTEHNRIKWLENLANPQVPLKNLSRAVPHGIKNKALLEQCAEHRIPIPRAIWLIRCVSINEQTVIKRKGSSTHLHGWVSNWTDQVTSFLAKNYELTADWRSRFHYAIQLVGKLYLGSLLDSKRFFAWIVEFCENMLKQPKSALCFKYLSLHLMVMKTFWYRLVEIDHIAKDLGQIFLKLYQTMEGLYPKRKDTDVGAALIAKILSFLMGELKTLTAFLFYYNSDSFVSPATWLSVKATLRKLLDTSNPKILDQFDIVAYRNESLMLEVTSTCGGHFSLQDLLMSQLTTALKTGDYQTVSIFHQGDAWDKSVSFLLQWCVTTYVVEEPYKRSVMACVMLEAEVNRQKSSLTRQKLKEFRTELESCILDFLMNFNEAYQMNDDVELHNLLQVVNCLMDYQHLSISSYVRRLIASGVIYLDDTRHKNHAHSYILENCLGNENASVRNILVKLQPRQKDTSAELLVQIIQQLAEWIILEGPKPDSYVLWQSELPPNVKQYLRGILVKRLREAKKGLITMESLCTLLPFFSDDVIGFFRICNHLLGLEGTNVDVSGISVMSSLIQNYTPLLSQAVEETYNEISDFANAFSVDKSSVRLRVELAEAGLPSPEELDHKIEFVKAANTLFGRLLDLIKSLPFEEKSAHKSKILCDIFLIKQCRPSELVPTLESFLSSNDLLSFEYHYMIEFLRDVFSFGLIDERATLIDRLGMRVLCDMATPINRNCWYTYYQSFEMGNLTRYIARENPGQMVKFLTTLLQTHQEEELDPLKVSQPVEPDHEMSLLFFKELLTYAPDVLCESLANEAIDHARLMQLLKPYPFMGTAAELSVDLLESIFSQINQFNLPVIELVVKHVVDQASRDQLFRKVSLKMVSAAEIDLVPLLAQSLRYLDFNFKSKVINAMEELFLLSEHFPKVVIFSETNCTILLNHLVTSISRLCTDPVPLTDSLLFSFNNALETMIDYSSTRQEDDALKQAIVFLSKLVLVHKRFLCRIITASPKPHSLVKNMIRLFNTELVNSDFRLKNLIYDTLLSLKRSVSESLISRGSAKDTERLDYLFHMSPPDYNNQLRGMLSTIKLGDALCELKGRENFFIRKEGKFCKLQVGSFDMLNETDPSPEANDGPLDLQCFLTSVEKQNP